MARGCVVKGTESRTRAGPRSTRTCSSIGSATTAIAVASGSPGAAERDARDCVTAEGLAAAGLPATYARDAVGDVVPRDRCQLSCFQACDDGLAGVLCRSAAGRDERDHELALFETAIDAATHTARLPFDEW